MTIQTELNFKFFCIILSTLVFVFFLIFSLISIKKGKKEKSLYLFAMICANQLLVLGAGFVELRSMSNWIPGLLSLMCLPLFVYIKGQDCFRRILPLALVYVMACAILTLFALLATNTAVLGFMKVLPLAIMGLLLFANWFLFLTNSTDRKHIIKDGQPRTHLYSELQANYTMLLMVFLTVLSVSYLHIESFWGSVLQWLSFLGVTLSCLMLLHSNLTGKVILFSKKWDDSVQSALKECVAESNASLKADQTYRAIYERLIAYFEVEKPFLDADLTLLQVAQKVYCNKLYLSKTINVYTGKNFCQFVNYHRIKHALKVFEEDTDIRINSWATMCGFRTVASFSMAFKLFVNESPGEWLRKAREISGKY